MSAWKLAVRALAQHGGAATTSAVFSGCDHFTICAEVFHAFKEARRLGLVRSEPAGYGKERRWHLTPLGVDYLDGRVKTLTERGRGGRRWVATWLASLPRGIRLCGSGCGEDAGAMTA